MEAELTFLLTLLFDEVPNKLIVGEGIFEEFDSLVDTLRQHSAENFGDSESCIDNTLDVIIIVFFTLVVLSVHKF